MCFLYFNLYLLFMLFRLNFIFSFFILLLNTSLSAQVTFQDSLDYLAYPLLDHPSSKGLLLNKSMSVFDIGSHSFKNTKSFCALDSLDHFVQAISKMGYQKTTFPQHWAQQLRDYYFQQKDSKAIPLVAFLVAVDKLRPNAWSSQKIKLNNGQLKVNGTWEEAMEEDTLLWVSPLVPTIEHPSHTTFKLDTLHWASNGVQVNSWRWRRLGHIEWQAFKVGDEVSFPSSTGKLDTIELEITCSNRVSIVRFAISRTWNELTKEHVKQWMVQATNHYQISDVCVGYQFQTVTIAGITLIIPVPIYQQQPILLRALVSVDHVDQSANPVIRKPFVIVEGVDFGYKERPIGCAYGRCGSLGYYEFLNARKRAYNPAHPDELLPEFNLSRVFVDSLKNEGFDVVFVDFEKGADYIQDNAMVLVEVIRQLKQKMIANDGMVVCGASMGGLVARYALAWMEHQGESHCVRDFISFDSPQEGANVPLSLQEFADYTARHNTFNFFNQSVDTRNRKFNAPASRQMMLANYEMPVGQPHPMRVTLLQDLQAIGNYPNKLRKIAISNGSLLGNTLPIGVGGNFLNLTIAPGMWPFIIAALNSNPLWAISSQFSSNSLFSYTAELYALCGANGIIFNGDAPLPGNQETVSTNSHCKTLDHLAGGISFHGIKDPIPWLNLIQVNHQEFCLIPAASALGMVPTGSSPVMVGTSLTPSGGIPFDAYWSAGTNERHVNLSLALISYVLERIRETSQESLDQLVLNRNILQLNLGKHTVMDINRSLEVPSGKILSFNREATINSKGQSISPSVGSLLNFSIGGCNPAEVKVKSSGFLIIGNSNWNNVGSLSGNLTVQSGSTLWIEGKLRLEANSSLLIEKGATLRLSQGGEIELADANCKLVIHGRLLLDPQADFYPKGNGTVEVGPGNWVEAYAQSRFALIGSPSTPSKLVILPNAQLIMPSSLGICELQNAQVIFNHETALKIYSPSVINSSNFKANSYNGPQRGVLMLTMNSKHLIGFNKFEYLKAGIETFGGAAFNDLEVNNCEFVNCSTGILQNASGLKLFDCQFLRNNQAVLSHGINRDTKISRSTFEQNTGGVYLETTSGINIEIERSKFINQGINALQIDNGNVLIFNSLFERTSSSAINLNNAQLRMTCSQLLNNAQAIEMDLGSSVDIGNSAGNNFRNNASVFFFNLSDPNNPDKLTWKNGKNDFRWNTQLISGNFNDIAIAFLPGSVKSVNTRIGPFEFFSVDPQDNLFNAPHPFTSSQLYWNVYGSYAHASGMVYPILVEPLAQLSKPFSCSDKLFAGDDAPIEINPTLPFTANRPMATTIINPSLIDVWKVYPNPVNQGWLEVLLPQSAEEIEVDIELMDISGKKIRQWSDRQGGNWRLDVSGLATGWYQVHVLSDSMNFPVKKVFIQNGL